MAKMERAWLLRVEVAWKARIALASTWGDFVRNLGAKSDLFKSETKGAPRAARAACGLARKLAGCSSTQWPHPRLITLPPSPFVYVDVDLLLLSLKRVLLIVTWDDLILFRVFCELCALSSSSSLVPSEHFARLQWTANK